MHAQTTIRPLPLGLIRLLICVTMVATSICSPTNAQTAESLQDVAPDAAGIRSNVSGASQRQSQRAIGRDIARHYSDPVIPGGIASVPPREGTPATATSAVRADLFARISASAMQAVVGLKTPGAPRGVWRATRLIDRPHFLLSVQKLRRLDGISVVATDEVLPFVVVQFRDRAAFNRLAAYQAVDYIEAANTGIQPQDFGCNAGKITWTPAMDSSGDIIPRTYGPNGIERAWTRQATGRGMVIGVVDTGLSSLQPEMMTDSFEAVGRSIEYQGCKNASCLVILPRDAWASCDHGPRLASVVGAPRNSTSIVGVAFEADMRVQKAGSSVWTEDEATKVDHLIAIRTVRAAGARIINMAFGSLFDSNALGDEIRFEFYRTDMPEVLFVGAAGTDVCPDVKPVAFPARMPEVFAVTGVNPDGTKESSACTGSEVRIAAFLMPFEAAGMQSGDVVSLGGTSGASAMVSGIAAMTWGRYPSLTRDQLITRLMQRSKPSQIGVPIIDAYAAVGGSRGGYILSSAGSAKQDDTYTFYARIDGDGPFSYVWNSGETTPQIQRTGPSHAEVRITDAGDGTIYQFEKSVGLPPSTNVCRSTCQADFNQCKASASNGQAIKVCLETKSSCLDACDSATNRTDR